MTIQDKELIQDVVDRLLYLEGIDRKRFEDLLNQLLSIYPIRYEIIDNVRVYPVDKTSLI